MIPLSIKPSLRLRSKFRLVVWLMLLLQLAWSLPLGYFIGLDAGGLPEAGVGLVVVLVLNVIWFLPTLWLVDRYYDSLAYELQEDEIIVRVGIWTHSVKHVPFRTITNIAIKRDILDRYLFNIGTVEIQTAGANSTQGGAEETLAGVVDYEGVYGAIAEALHRYRALPLGPNQASTDAAPLLGEAEGSLAALLGEVRSIRLLLQQQNGQATSQGTTTPEDGPGH